MGDNQKIELGLQIETMIQYTFLSSLADTPEWYSTSMPVSHVTEES